MSDNNVLESRFDSYRDKRIAVYGLGENARILLENCNRLNILCLVANDHIGEEKFGKKILSIDDAVKETEVIIVAASFSATSIICSRIREHIPDEMPVLNMLGENLALSDQSENNSYWSKSYKELLGEIDSHEVVSFDIFDTLIMRNVLEATDIFWIVSKKTNSPSFYSERIIAEKNCRSSETEPTITDIYSFIKSENNSKLNSSIDYKAYELITEKIHICPRSEMTRVLNYSISKGKKVFLTSDMYMNVEEISSLLSECRINGKYEMLISSESGSSKFSGDLFNVLRERAGSSKILHIGDDELVDESRAKEKGIDTYLIYSSYRMLASSHASYIFDDVKSICDKMYLGWYISRVFNDPFVLCGSKGRIPIRSEKEIAYLLYPITKLFFDFILDVSGNYDCILFPSRDGWFLYNIYCEYRKSHPEYDLPEAKYIYSSRMSLSMATLIDNDTFDVLIHKLFGNRSKNCKKYIKDLFGVDIPDEFDSSCGELIELWGKNLLLQKLHECVPLMIEALSKKRDLYINYTESIGINEYSKPAMIDIVSYGTQPYCLSHILGKPVDMISIGSTGIPNVFMNEDSVRSVYGNVNEEVNGTLVSKSDLSILHIFLEVLYSSSDGQFLEISESGEPVFLAGSEYNDELLGAVQKELTGLFNDHVEIQADDARFSPEFSHGMLRLLRSKYSVMDEELKNKFLFSDPYDGGFVTVNISDSL